MGEIHLKGHERIGVGQQVVSLLHGEVARGEVGLAAAGVVDGKVRVRHGVEVTLRNEVTHAAALRHRVADRADLRAPFARDALVAVANARCARGHVGDDLGGWEGGWGVRRWRGEAVKG